MKQQLPYNENKFLEFCRGNPNTIARRIVKANVDEVATYSLINKIRDYLFNTGAFLSLQYFNEELGRQGWGKNDEKKEESK